MIIQRDTPLPLTFRERLLQHIMPALLAGECCSLIGVSGVGKSNLVRFLQRSDVQSHYWGDEEIWVVSIDTYGLVFGDMPDEYVVAELIIHRLIREAERRQLPKMLLDEFNQRYEHLIERPSAHLALRYLERICGRLCDTQQVRLVFVFDQFEDLWRELDARFFLNLRYLRDQFKYQLMYLVITREQLQRIRKRACDDLLDVEAFWELFSSHVYGLGMYNEDDAISMMHRIAQRRGLDVEARIQQTSFAASGGHPGLMRAILWKLCQDTTFLDMQASLLHIASIAEECRKIWSDLQPEEQNIIRSVAANLKLLNPPIDVLDDLQRKQIVVGEPYKLFSPLFTSYVLAQSGGDMVGIIVDLRLRQVWLDNQLLTEPLSRLEFRPLEYLARHADTVCTREEILRELYQEDAYNANDERLDTLLRRLREALREDARNPRYLFTHRGVGVRLAHGQVRD